MTIQTASVLKNASERMQKIYLLMILYRNRSKKLADLQPLLELQPMTLRKHARKLGLSFSDYDPAALQPKEGE